MNETEESPYSLMDNRTGEIIPIDVIEDKPGRWDRVYGKALADMLEHGGSGAKIIAFLVRNRDYKNVVMASVREIANKADVSTRTAMRTLKSLEDKNFIIRLRPGVIMFSPHVIRTGKNTAGLAVLRRWKDVTEEVSDEHPRNRDAGLDPGDDEADSVPRTRSSRFEGIGLAAASEFSDCDTSWS